MKYAVSTYSFQQYISKGNMTQLDCVAAAKEMGFDGIEFVGVIPQGAMSVTEYARKLAEACGELNLEVVNFCTGADFLNPEKNLADEIEKVKRGVDIAACLGSPGMRHDATGGPKPYQSFDSVLPILSDACREITEYARSAGVRTMVENHGFFCQDSERMEKLITAVGHKNFGALVDMGNFLCADEEPHTAVARMAPYAFMAHAKDFVVKSGDGPDPGDGFFTSRAGTYLKGTVVGHGNVPVLQCLRALRRAGYDGAVSLEFEGMEDASRAIKAGLANLKRYVASLA